jgi:hypothetical protein
MTTLFKTLVRQDAAGLFVVAGGWIGRPDPNPGEEGFRTFDGVDFLQAGGHVAARHIRGTNRIAITCPDGKKLTWRTSTESS